MRTRTKKMLALSAALAVGLSLAAAALAKHRLTSTNSGFVKLYRNQVVGHSAHLSPRGGYISLINAEIEFECPSSTTLFPRDSAVTTLHDRQPMRVKRGTLVKRRAKARFPRIKVATHHALIAACLKGKKTYSTTIEAEAGCYSDGYMARLPRTSIPVTFSLKCSEIIPDDETFARVRVKTYRHDCPPGFKLPDGRNSTVRSSGVAMKCIRR